MSLNRHLIVCGCLFAAAGSAAPLYAQPASVPKVTPNGAPGEESPPETRPTFEPMPVAPAPSATSSVSRLLGGDTDYKKGDLLTWERVKPVLDRLRRSRVPLPPEKELRAKFLSQNDPLVRMFSTKNGQAFFNELAKNPSSIDLVDRYRALPRGESFLQQMINDKDGFKFFTEPYWLTARDAKLAGEGGLANVPNGNKFGEPTGRIYTESQLVAFLADYRAGSSKTYE